MSTRAAKRYAKAILDLALEKKQEDVMSKDMEFISESIEASNELKMLLNSPVFKVSDKKQALEAIFSKNTSELTTKLIGLLADNKRIGLLPLITKSYAELYNEIKKTVSATVTTAFPISDSLREKVMTKAVELAGNKTVSLENKIDENIIGGFILRVGDVQIDASIANKLKTLERELKN